VLGLAALLPVAAGAEDEAVFVDDEVLAVDGVLIVAGVETGVEIDEELEAGGVEAEIETEPDEEIDEAPGAGAAPPPSWEVSPLPTRYAGRASASFALVRLPSPQGTAWPSGCVCWGGGVTFPLGSAIAQRVVQVRAEGFAGVENW